MGVACVGGWNWADAGLFRLTVPFRAGVGVNSGHPKWGEYRHKAYRFHRPDPRLIMDPVMRSIQFKTFAWMVPRHVWDVVQPDMQSIADWVSDGTSAAGNSSILPLP